jgi:RNA-directed DNA polymerase
VESDALALQEAPEAHLKQLGRRYFGARRHQDKSVTLYNGAAMRVLRYRYRGTLIATPWNEDTVDVQGAPHRRITNDDPRALEALEDALA